MFIAVQVIFGNLNMFKKDRISGLDLYLNGRLENTPGTSCLTVVAFVMRIVQVVVQSVFILVASR